MTYKIHLENIIPPLNFFTIFLYQAFFDLLFEILAIMMYCLPNVSQFYEVRKLFKCINNRHHQETYNKEPTHN